MGHYDSCYEADERARAKENDKKQRDKLSKFCLEGNIYDIEFINKIIKNIEDWQGFYNLLKNKK